MSKLLLLDSGPLGRLAHPKRTLVVSQWIAAVHDSGDLLVIPEIADYEVRRSLLLAGLGASIVRLNCLRETLDFVAIDSQTMLLAAELWADARRRGRPTAAPSELDGDVILAAQAILVGAVVVTDNSAHVAQFVDTLDWQTLAP